MITGVELMKISRPEDLFPKDEREIKKLYRELVKMYHPDVYGNDDVFRRINELYKAAMEKIKTNSWGFKNTLTIKSDSGKKISLNYIKKHNFELGEMYIANKVVLYLLPKSNEKYYTNYIDKVKSIKYADESMENEFALFIPKIIRHGKTESGDCFIVILKYDDVLYLPDILSKFKISNRHACWMISRIINLCCLMKYNNLSFNNININSIFICPRTHKVFLFDWWYVTKLGEKMIGLPKFNYNLMTPTQKASKLTSSTLDIDSVKAFAMTMKSYTEGDVPKEFELWAKGGSSEDTFKEFSEWDKCLDASYGERKFVVLDITKNHIYEEAV